jgi:muramidase (phage lysozyme)
LPRHTKTTAKKGYNILYEFQEAVVVAAPPEFLVVEEYGLPRQTETTAKKGYNFLSDPWIALKLLQ